MELLAPTTQYKDSFIEAVREHKVTDVNNLRVRDLVEISIKELERDFEEYIAKFQEESRGENLPEGYVPCTTYWLIDKGEFIGRVSIRHQLTPHLLREGGHIGYDIRPSKRNKGYGKQMLALALPKAKELGIQKVLVTCNETNIGSKKIIEQNGGVLENKLESTDGSPAKLRYWITT